MMSLALALIAGAVGSVALVCWTFDRCQTRLTLALERSRDHYPEEREYE